jgi:hypothetical protein
VDYGNFYLLSHAVVFFRDRVVKKTEIFMNLLSRVKIYFENCNGLHTSLRQKSSINV